jgi:hypothetical protein
MCKITPQRAKHALSFQLDASYVLPCLQFCQTILCMCVGAYTQLWKTVSIITTPLCPSKHPQHPTALGSSKQTLFPNSGDLTPRNAFDTQTFRWKEALIRLLKEGPSGLGDFRQLLLSAPGSNSSEALDLVFHLPGMGGVLAGYVMTEVRDQRVLLLLAGCCSTPTAHKTGQVKSATAL